MLRRTYEIFYSKISKKIFGGKKILQRLIYKWKKNKHGEMLEITDYERELLIECIQFRLETDKTVNSNEILREELEELLFKVEESDDYV